MAACLSLQAQHRKIEHLEAELRATKASLEESNSVQSEALQRHAEMQQEIENNAGELIFTNPDMPILAAL